MNTPLKVTIFKKSDVFTMNTKKVYLFNVYASLLYKISLKIDLFCKYKKM